jgi:hypothetical protein
MIFRNDRFVIFSTSTLSINRLSSFKPHPSTMFQAVLIASLAASAVAFRPAVMARPSLTKVSMSAEGLAGQTAPLGFFDPLSLSAGKTAGEIKVVLSTLTD